MSSSKVSNIASRTGQRDPSRGSRPSVSPDPLVEAKFAIPRRQSVTLRRTRLLRLLRSARDRPVISIVAPPGYGKTSLLVQWATESSGPVAWLTADDSDSDPVVLLTDLAAAIDRVEPLGTEIFVAIASAAVSNRAVVGRLLAGMSRPPEGVRIVIDDGYRITSRSCLDILAELVAHLPEGSQVAIAGRERMRLPFARWRAEGSLLEIGPVELAMDEREAAGLGRELGLRLPADTTTRLARRTDGWPALLALATLGARTSERGPRPIDAGSDQLVEDYLRSEVLDGRSETEIAFLTRTSILERLSAPLCDAVMDRPGSTSVLRMLGESTLLVDDYGGAYRYHTLLRDFLRRELAVREPEVEATLHRRASAWYQANDAYEPAVRSRVRGGRSRPRRNARRQRLAPVPLVRPSSDDPIMGNALRSRCPPDTPLARRAGCVGGTRRGRCRRDGALRGHRRAWNVRGQATRRHGLLRGRAGDAPGRHGPPGRRRRPGKRRPGGRARGGHRLVAGLRALAAGHRSPHGGRPGWRRRGLCRRDQGCQSRAATAHSATASSGTAPS